MLPTRTWALDNINRWTDSQKYGAIRYTASWNLPGAYAKFTNGTKCEYCQWTIEGGKRHGYCEMVLKVQSFDNGDLLTVWMSLKHYDPQDFYDKEAKVTMDEWAQTVYSGISSRNLDWLAHERQFEGDENYTSLYFYDDRGNRLVSNN